MIETLKLHPNAKMPIYATEGSAGADICACLYDKETGETITKMVLPAGGKAKIHTGLAFAVPEGKFMLLAVRSSAGVKKGLALQNTIGVLDSDYRGECLLFIENKGDKPATIENGERIAQAIILDVNQLAYQSVDKLDDTKRGAGGFGSTGTK